MGKQAITLVCFMTVSSARNGRFTPGMGMVAEAALRASRRRMVAFNAVSLAFDGSWLGDPRERTLLVGDAGVGLVLDRDSLGTLFFLIRLGENLPNEGFHMAVGESW
jgi:hypothetical protein